jgi:hypothetical protein
VQEGPERDAEWRPARPVNGIVGATPQRVPERCVHVAVGAIRAAVRPPFVGVSPLPSGDLRQAAGTGRRPQVGVVVGIGGAGPKMLRPVDPRRLEHAAAASLSDPSGERPRHFPRRRPHDQPPLQRRHPSTLNGDAVGPEFRLRANDPTHLLMRQPRFGRDLVERRASFGSRANSLALYVSRFLQPARGCRDSPKGGPPAHVVTLVAAPAVNRAAIQPSKRSSVTPR